MNNYNQTQYGNPQNQQYSNNQVGDNWQRPPQNQYNNQYNNNNNNNNWNPPQHNNNRQYNNQYNNNSNQYQPQPQQQQQYNNNNTCQPPQQPLQTSSGKGGGGNNDDGWGFSSKPNDKPKKNGKKQKSGYSEKLARFGGIWGILAIIIGIAAVLCVVIGMSSNEITTRDRTATAATKCGYFAETICGEPIMTGLFKANFDVECKDVDGKDCCTFKMKDACQLGFICAEGDTCVYCDNLKAGTLFFWICMIALIIVCVSTLCICITFTRKFAWIGYSISIIILIIGLIAYPTMIGSVDREKGCGGNAYCCYFTECDANDENCPTPVGQTYIAMIITIIFCIIAITLLFISKKRS